MVQVLRDPIILCGYPLISLKYFLGEMDIKNYSLEDGLEANLILIAACTLLFIGILVIIALWIALCPCILCKVCALVTCLSEDNGQEQIEMDNVPNDAPNNYSSVYHRDAHDNA